MDKFRHHQLGILEEMVDATHHEVGLDDICNIFQRVNIEKVFNMNFGFFVLQIDFHNKNGHWCKSNDL